MGYKNLLLERRDAVAWLTVNRPEVRNALNPETWRELDRAIAEVAADDEVRALVITGAGDRAFVAGADIQHLSERDMLNVLRESYQDILGRLESLRKPVVAAINGFALGGGCELAMACDIRIAAESAKLGQPEVNLGILPGAGGTQRLLRLVGFGKAKELIMTGDIIDAQEAWRIGLVNKVVPDEQLLEAAEETVGKILSKGPLAVEFAKQALHVGMNVDLQSGLAFERMAQAVLFSTEDRIEGTTAFLQKRKPDFQGR